MYWDITVRIIPRYIKHCIFYIKYKNAKKVARDVIFYYVQRIITRHKLNNLRAMEKALRILDDAVKALESEVRIWTKQGDLDIV